MHPSGSPRTSTTDPRVAILVHRGIYEDAVIQSFYADCKQMFQRFLAQAPALSFEVHRAFFDEAMFAQLQSARRSAERTTVGGVRNQSANIAQQFESAKVVALPIAMAERIRRGDDETKLLSKVLPSFRTRPNDVLTTVQNTWPWLMPSLDNLAHIRNSECHSGTLFDDSAALATFRDGKGVSLELTYDEVSECAQHFAVGMMLIFDVQVEFYGIGLTALLRRYESEYTQEELRRSLERMRTLVPPPDDEERQVAKGLQQLAAEAIRDELHE